MANPWSAGDAWMQEVEVEYTINEDEEAVDPLSIDCTSTMQRWDEDRKGKSGPFESLGLVVHKMASSAEGDKDEEEVEIEFTREVGTADAVDPLGEGDRSAGGEDTSKLEAPTDKTAHDSINPIGIDGNDGPRLVASVTTKSHEQTGRANHNRDAETNLTRTPEKLKKYACKLCNYQGHNRLNFQHHCRAHHGDQAFENALKSILQPRQGQPVECDICGRKFMIAGWLIRHMEKHRGEPSKFANLVLQQRSSIHPTNAAAKPAEEESGPSSMKGSDGNKQVQFEKQRAVTVSPAIGTRFACQSCEYRSDSRNNLRRHALCHDAPKPNRCKECSYTCVNKGYLKIHARIHRGGNTNKVERKRGTSQTTKTERLKKLHDCTICHYRTNQIGNLRVHLMTHTGERPYKCSVCHSRYTQAGALKVHMRRHTGDRPYRCDICDKGFPQLAGLNNHKNACSSESRKTITTGGNCNYNKTHSESQEQTGIHCSSSTQADSPSTPTNDAVHDVLTNLDLLQCERVD